MTSRPNALFNDHWRVRNNYYSHDMRKSDKENRHQSTGSSRHRSKRDDAAFKAPTTSTQICSVKPLIFEQKMREKELFSTSSSSWSDDEQRPSTSRKKARDRLSTFHSISDLTTSDSSIAALRETYFSMDSRDERLITTNPSTYTSSEITHDMSESEDSDEEYEINERALHPTQRLESIEESPVLPPPSNIHDDCELPPQIPPLPFDTPMRFPHTNPNHVATHLTATHRRFAANEQPISLFQKTSRPEDFYMPSQIAKRYGTEGVLFLTISMTGHGDKYLLDLTVQYANYFLTDYAEVSTYVQAEIKPNKRLRKRSCDHEKLDSFRSAIVPRSHQPNFNCDFQFLLNRDNFRAHDRLTLSVFVVGEERTKTRELLGRMTFPLSRLRKKAKINYNNARRMEDVKTKVCDGGYFLLNEYYGNTTNLPLDKVEHTKFYDGIWSDSLAETNDSLDEMMGESEWQTALKYKNVKNNPMLDSRRHSVQTTMPPNGRAQQQSFSQYHRSHLLSAMPSNGPTERSYGIFNGSPRKKVSLPMRAASSDQQPQNSLSRRLLNKPEKAVNSSCSSSRCVSSSSSSGSGYKSYKRFTVPSITTTITTDSSECAINTANQPLIDSLLHNVDHQYLYADAAPSQQPTKTTAFKSAATKSRLFREHKTTSVSNHRPLSNQTSGCNEDLEKTQSHGTVRRVASFTYSGDSIAVKNSKTAIAGKKFTLGPISKIGNFLRGKVDSANSTSTLYPNQMEIRRWQDSFDNLLRDKYGCHLFRQFVEKEISSENLDFYQDVEEFKKLKAGKKSTVQRANEIFNIYFDENADKELNLDSCTKNSTKAALKAGALPDTFNLAQSRIEQLMAKDSYRRFLQSDMYLKLLNSNTPPASTTVERKVVESLSAPSSACTPDENVDTGSLSTPLTPLESKGLDCAVKEKSSSLEIVQVPTLTPSE
ncbi:CRE-RGS-7 protein [Aphelenchoides besseyi]|nr:CRE-RGS-7 protein [Aphelenchoides besseyi]KAI6209627.1 CRE-RGS-7 protein [Aphelenchoides besseyi]